MVCGGQWIMQDMAAQHSRYLRKLPQVCSGIGTPTSLVILFLESIRDERDYSFRGANFINASMLTKPEEFIALVDQGDESSQKRLRSETAPESVWKEIILKYPDYRHAVSSSKSLPTAILTLLATDSSPVIRSIIAMKRALPSELFALLAADSDESVRARIAWNKKTPHDLLQKLARDVSPVVAEPAKKRLAQT